MGRFVATFKKLSVVVCNIKHLIVVLDSTTQKD